jgi:hypothetical protein
MRGWERLLGGKDEDDKPQARSEFGRELQKSLGAPAALMDAISEQVGEKVLKKAKWKGPKH